MSASKPKLTAAEREAITARYFRGECDRETFLAAHEPLIGKVFRACFRSWSGGRRVIPSSLAEVGDLAQAGWIGLSEALDRFDPARGVRFSTHAAWWIKRAMLDEAGDGEPLPVPRDYRSIVHKLTVTGQPLTAAQTGLVKRCPNVIRAGVAARALTAPDRRVSPHRLASRPGDGPARPEAAPEAADTAAFIRRAVAALPPVERAAIVSHYGLDGAEPRTFRQLAEAEGNVTPAAIQDRKTRAFKRLWGRLESLA